MKRFLRNFGERLIEGLLTLSGTVTSVTVLLIIIFLFREGISLFRHSPVEEGYVLIVHRENPVSKLEPLQVKNIYDRKLHLWKEVGGQPVKGLDSIHIMRVSDFSEAELGADLSLLPAKINEQLQKHPNLVAAVPVDYLPKDNFLGRRLPMDNISPGYFLTGEEWFPTAQPVAQLGILSLILGTLWVSLGAILIALPLALATAIFMAEIASKRVRSILKPVVELLAGIPSVVYGFFGLAIIVPAIQDITGKPGETALAGSIILGIMALPTIITIAEDALRTTPRALKEASLALGASQWQTIRKVVIPYASSGITAGIILGVGRAIGETMAVLMVTGNAAKIPTGFLQPVRTIPATIAAELGEAPYGGLHFKALFALGCILFLITFLINLSFQMVARRRRKRQ